MEQSAPELYLADAGLGRIENFVYNGWSILKKENTEDSGEGEEYEETIL